MLGNGQRSNDRRASAVIRRKPPALARRRGPETYGRWPTPLILLCHHLRCTLDVAPQPPPAPGPREQRLAAFLQGLAQAARHRDRHQPLTSDCLGLLLPGERKSVEPLAARLDPHNVWRAHQSPYGPNTGLPSFPWSAKRYLSSRRLLNSHFGPQPALPNAARTLQTTLQTPQSQMPRTTPVPEFLCESQWPASPADQAAAR